MLTLHILAFALLVTISDVTAYNDDAYVIGLFPDPIYDTGNRRSREGKQTLTTSITNAGGSSQIIGFHAYLPNYVDVTSFSMKTDDTSYMGMKSNRSGAAHAMNRAITGGHNAVIYVPKSSPDKYEDDVQTAGNSVHIKGHNEMTFDLKYKSAIERISNLIKLLNRVHITVDVSGITTDLLSIELTSPNYPESYPNSADITWLVQVPVGKTVSLQITDLDIEECCDRLAIYDGVSIRDDIIAEITGNFTDLSTRNFQSTRNSMFLRLTSDCSLSLNGFKAMVTVQSVVNDTVSTTTLLPVYTTASEDFTTAVNTTPYTCSSMTSTLYAFPTSESYLLSPGYPLSYLNNLDCSWRFRAIGGFYIRLTIQSLDLTPCCDSIAVYDGFSSRDRLLNRFYGTAPSQTVVFSSGSYLFLNFVTDSSRSGRGFRLAYQSVYSHEVSTVPMQSTAASTTTSSTTTSSTTVFSTTTSSFAACSPGGTHVAVFDGSGFIYSPNYPNFYERNSHCSWLLQGYYFQYIIRISVYDINLGFGDVVRIFDGATQSSPLISSLTGTYLPPNVYSTGPNMFITFTSNGFLEGRGFRFSYGGLRSYNQSTTVSPTIDTTAMPTFAPQTGDPAGCLVLQELVAYNFISTLSSPNYPSRYNNNLNCEWRISSSNSFDLIRLEVLFLDLERGYDVLHVFDGYSPSQLNRLEDLSGNDQPTLHSTGAFMYLNFITDHSVVGGGFLLQYTSVYRPDTTLPHTETTTVETSGYGQ